MQYVLLYSQELWTDLLEEFVSQYKIFMWQKRVIIFTRIVDCGNTGCCRNLFIKLDILTFMSKYILFLLIHTHTHTHTHTHIYIYIYIYIYRAESRDKYLINSDVHNINTRHFPNLHLSWTNLVIYQSEVHVTYEYF